MNKMTVAMLALALSGSAAFAQGFGGAGQQGQQGQQGGRRQRQQQGGGMDQMPGGMGGFGGGMGQMPGGMGGMPGGMGGMGGMPGGMGGFGGGMGGMTRNGQLAQTIERLKVDTPREAALKKIEAKDKDAYAKIVKSMDEANTKLAELAKKAEVELPDTAEQQKAKVLAFLTKEKEAIDKLLETDKTDSMTAMRSFNELAQKAKVTLTPAGGRGMGMMPGMGGMGGMGGMPGGMGGAQQPGGRGGTATSMIRQIQEKFPAEYEAAQKLRAEDPTAYREKMRELQQKVRAAQPAPAAN